MSPSPSGKVRALDTVREKSSKPECKGYKVRGIDTGPCGSKVVNYTAVTAIVLIFAVLCFVGFMKWKYSWDRAAKSRRTQVLRRCARDHDNGQGNEQQERVIQRLQSDRHLQLSLTARAVTDLSEQQNQLTERLAALQQSALELQRRRDLHLSVNARRLRAPDVAHLRDRERNWELYQIRSNQELVTEPEYAGCIVHRVQSDQEPVHLTRPIRVYPSIETLPEYAAEDPLKREERCPAYWP
ncbi:MAG: hypothetical protein Q9182_000366 [Xanthomendoza sp. 2 TL-2023]